MKKFFLLIIFILLLTTVVSADYIPPSKILNYSSETGTATHVYVNRLEVGISTTVRNVILLGTGTVRAKEGAFEYVLGDGSGMTGIEAGVSNPMIEALDANGQSIYDAGHISCVTIISTSTGIIGSLLISYDGTKIIVHGQSGGYVSLGSEVTNHNLSLPSQLVVHQLEVNSSAFFDSYAYFFNSVEFSLSTVHKDGKPAYFGTGSDAELRWNTVYGPVDFLYLTTKCNNAAYTGHIMIVESADIATDWGIAAVPDPHVRIQSSNKADTNEYIQFWSSSPAGGNGCIATGKDLVLLPAGGEVHVKGNIRADAYEIHASSFFLHSLPNISSNTAIDLIENIKEGSNGLLDKSTMGNAYIPAHERTKKYKCRTLIEDSTWQYELTEKEVTIQEEAVTNMPVLWSAIIKTLQVQQKEISKLKSEIKTLKQ